MSPSPTTVTTSGITLGSEVQVDMYRVAWRAGGPRRAVGECRVVISLYELVPRTCSSSVGMALTPRMNVLVYSVVHTG